MSTDPRITVISDNVEFREFVFALKPVVENVQSIFRVYVNGTVAELSIWTPRGFEKVCLIPDEGNALDPSSWGETVSEGIETAVRFASALVVQS